jgi:O-antigen ligase
MLLLSSAIVFSFAVRDAGGYVRLKWGLLGCLLILASMVVLHQAGVPIKSILPAASRSRPDLQLWNEKHVSYWLIILMWGVVAFHWRASRLGTVVAASAAVLTGFAVFGSYGDSARLALGVSLVVFAIMHVPYRHWLRLAQALVCVYVLAFPWAWERIPASGLAMIGSIPLNHVRFRTDLYDYSVGLIGRQWLGGYGLGSAEGLLRPFPLATGGHPHNIVLYFWLELGLLGAVVLALAAVALLGFVHRTTRSEPRGPAVWALVSVGIVVSSFGFDIWLPGVVLMYAMWMGIIALSCRGAARGPGCQPDPASS